MNKMDFSNETVNDLIIAYIGGGSMNWARELMGDLAIEPQLSGVVRLYDIDFEAAKINETIGNQLSDYPETCGKWVYEAKRTLEDTLTNADFVVISILPGTFDEMESDVHTPEKYGIYQSVGDTVGPGGILRSMRAIPMYVEIAEAIKVYCPSAWIINYTNPMSACTGTLYRIFPQIKAFGCCHEVFHLQRLMVNIIISEFNGGFGNDINYDSAGSHNYPDISRDDICMNVLGVNHFTWVDKAHFGKIDLMPLFDNFAAAYVEKGFAVNETDNDQNNPFRNSNKVCFDLYRRFKVIPAAGDRHIAEFLPPWYLKDPDTVEHFGFKLTSVAYRKQTRQKLLKQTGEILSGKEKYKLKSSGEEGVKQIKALLGLSQLVTNVNLPNRGQTDGLPMGAIVESNAIFEKDAVRPIFSGRLPSTINTIVARHAENQKQIVEAGINKDTSLAFGVFINDNQMILNIKDAEKLFREMLINTKKYLHGWDLCNWI